MTLIGTMLLLGTAAIAQVVAEKPIAPRTIVQKPPRPSNDHVWIDGEWTWNDKTSTYEWERGGWTKAEAGKTYKPGYWRKVEDGWEYVPGRWV